MNFVSWFFFFFAFRGQYTLLANTSGEASQWVKHITAAHQKYQNPENKINVSRFPSEWASFRKI
jgi:hypothetical protein